MSTDIIVPEPVLWHDPASLPERALRAFERHKDWIPSQEVSLVLRDGVLYCCALAAICRDAGGDYWPVRQMGAKNFDSFVFGFDGQDWRAEFDTSYFEAGKRAWELVKPLAEERRRELNA